VNNIARNQAETPLELYFSLPQSIGYAHWKTALLNI